MFDLTRIFLSFVVGGFICLIIQLLIDLTKLTPARILVFLVCFGVFLGGVGLYEKMFELFGAGVSVPLLGFGATVAKGVMKAVDEFGALGILKGPFSAAAAGCSAALVFGYLACLLFKGKPKNT